MVYTAFRIPVGHIDEAIDSIRVLDIRGLSVTIPHKVDIIPHLDDVDETAWKVGSVNTVFNNNGRLKGFTTDGLGALRALADYDVDPKNKTILVLGSGGAARAITFELALLKEKPKLVILGVEEDEAKRLAIDLEQGTGVEVAADLLDNMSLPYHIGRADLLINATPVGMTPKIDETPVAMEMLRSNLAVFDAVYTPGETRLLKEAREKGARVIPGLGMFVHQAAIQFEIWTGTKAPVALMTETVLEALGEKF
jgi:shikimate dehydrogenase